MIAFRGQIHFKVYSPDKPDRYGIKAYELNDSQNGYCCQFSLYTGKTEEAPSRNGKTNDLVMNLMEPYLNKGFTLFVDNY